MVDLHPWSSARAVERALEAEGAPAVREWLAANWNRAFLDADLAALRLLVPLLDLARVPDRAATVLFAAAHDWPDVLEAADAAGCGFTPAFWAEAFDVARGAGSARCVAWLLDRKGDALARPDAGLEL